MRRKKCVYLDILIIPLLELSYVHTSQSKQTMARLFSVQLFLFIQHQFVALCSNMHFISVLWTEEIYENSKNSYQILENGLQ